MAGLPGAHSFPPEVPVADATYNRQVHAFAARNSTRGTSDLPGPSIARARTVRWRMPRQVPTDRRQCASRAQAGARGDQVTGHLDASLGFDDVNSISEEVLRERCARWTPPMLPATAPWPAWRSVTRTYTQCIDLTTSWSSLHGLL